MANVTLWFRFRNLRRSSSRIVLLQFEVILQRMGLGLWEDDNVNQSAPKRPFAFRVVVVRWRDVRAATRFNTQT